MPRIPIFPKFVLDEGSWITSAKFPAWSGYAKRGSRPGLAKGAIRIVFAPEGRDAQPLTPTEIGLVKWVVDNHASIQEAMLRRIHQEYPRLRAEALEDWVDPAEAEAELPEVAEPGGLKALLRPSTLYVHQIAKRGMPYVGVSMGCPWDDEHGLGILLHGTVPVKLGGSDTAFLLWIAKEHAGRVKKV